MKILDAHMAHIGKSVPCSLYYCITPFAGQVKLCRAGRNQSLLKQISDAKTFFSFEYAKCIIAIDIDATKLEKPRLLEV